MTSYLTNQRPRGGGARRGAGPPRLAGPMGSEAAARGRGPPPPPPPRGPGPGGEAGAAGTPAPTATGPGAGARRGGEGSRHRLPPAAPQAAGPGAGTRRPAAAPAGCGCAGDARERPALRARPGHGGGKRGHPHPRALATPGQRPHGKGAGTAGGSPRQAGTGRGQPCREANGSRGAAAGSPRCPQVWAGGQHPALLPADTLLGGGRDAAEATQPRATSATIASRDPKDSLHPARALPAPLPLQTLPQERAAGPPRSHRPQTEIPRTALRCREIH